MESVERTENRGRAALRWGTTVMVVFAFLAAIVAAITQLGPEVPNADTNIGAVFTAGLGLIAFAGFIAMLFGFVEMALVRRRERHPIS